MGKPDTRRSGDRGLLAALVASVRGDVNASSQYERLLRTWRRTDGRRALTAVLASRQFAAEGDSARAVEVLDLSFTISDAWTVMLALHRGVRLADGGDPTAGLEVTLEADERLTNATHLSEEGEDLAWIIRGNLMHLRRQSLHEWPTPTHELLRRPEPITEIEDRIGAGLGAFFDGNFETALRSFESRSVTFRSQDPVTAELDGARLRSECLADLELLRRTQRLAGRWHLLNSLGRPDGNPEPGFELLRQAKDRAGLESALRHARRVGPLRALRTVGTVALGRRWTPSDLTMNLVVIRESADVLPTTTVDNGVARVLGEWDSLLALAGKSQVRHEVIETLGALATSASQSQQTEVSATLLRIASGPANHVDLSSVANALRSIDWRAVDPQVREGWRTLAGQQLGVPTALGSVAYQAAATASQVDTEAWISLISERYLTTRQPLLGALLEYKDWPIDKDIVSLILLDAVGLVRSIIDNAHTGSYGFGRQMDAPTLLASLFFRTGERRAWDLVLELLLDSRVSSDDKEPTIDYLARNADRLDNRERSELLEGGNALLGFLDPFFGGRAGIEGAVFRLRLATGSVEDYTAISHLAAWCASGDPAYRLEAAKSILFFQPAEVGNLLAILLHGLVRDTEPSVSSQALYALAEKDWTSQESLKAVSSSLLVEMMKETDGRRPLGVLEGLHYRLANKGSIDSNLRSNTALLASNHLSSRVRRSAQRVLDLLSDGGAPQSGHEWSSQGPSGS